MSPSVIEQLSINSATVKRKDSSPLFPIEDDQRRKKNFTKSTSPLDDTSVDNTTTPNGTNNSQLPVVTTRHHTDSVITAANSTDNGSYNNTGYLNIIEVDQEELPSTSQQDLSSQTQQHGQSRGSFNGRRSRLDIDQQQSAESNN